MQTRNIKQLIFPLVFSMNIILNGMDHNPQQKAITQVFDVANFIWAERGNFPVILTVPHGGSIPIPNVSERKTGITVCDIKTFELAEQINSNLLTMLNKKPYIVAARFSRKYIDANRNEVRAFDQQNCSEVQTLYKAYHEYIANFVQEIRQKYAQAAILLDIHGQSKNKYAIYRGTQNGKTISALIKDNNIQALCGEHSILGYLALQNYSILPQDKNVLLDEDPHFDGGYTVKTYGSHTNNGINAMQLEFGLELRYTQEKRSQTALDMAAAIANFSRHYLEPKKDFDNSNR